MLLGPTPMKSNENELENIWKYLHKSAAVQYNEVFAVSQMHLCLLSIYLPHPYLLNDWQRDQNAALLAVAITWWGKTGFLPETFTDIVNQALSLI